MKYHIISEFFISLYLKRLFIIIFLYINIKIVKKFLYMFNKIFTQC